MVKRLGRTAQKRKWALEGIENACHARLEIREKGFPKEGDLAPIALGRCGLPLYFIYG